MRGIDYFSKIYINDKETIIEEIDNNEGIINSNDENVDIKFVLKDNTKLPKDLFNNVSKINNIVFPKGMTTICQGAFNDTEISSIDMSNVIDDANNMNVDMSQFNLITDPYLIEYIKTFVRNNQNTTFRELLLNLHQIVNQESDNPSVMIGQYTNDVYEVGDIYEKTLVYTERSGQRREQIIGTCKLKIVEIDHELDNDDDPHADQFRLKIKVIEVNITNPLSGINIDYEAEILNRYFFSQATFINANIDFFSTIPNWRNGIDGVDSFFAMEGQGDTYYPELENFFGVTDYAVRKLSNDEHKIN